MVIYIYIKYSHRHREATKTWWPKQS